MSLKPPLRQAAGLASVLLLTTVSSFAVPAQAATAQHAQPQASTFYDALNLRVKPFADVWERLRAGFRLPHDTDNPRVQHWIAWYQAHPQFFMHSAEQTSLWLRFVVFQIQDNGIPTEIALLPFVESAYDPSARNPGGSVGLWQFMPRTGDAMGLERTWWYDGRQDVPSATRAALTYLQMQADQWYDGDWPLALAAYNAGAGTVNKARDVAAHQGKPVDYWHLHLPAETMDYVPKLLALSAIVARPGHYGIELPHISDTPKFAQVGTHGQLDIKLAATLAGTSEKKIRALNPAYHRWATRPQNNPPLLIPVDNKQTFLANLAALPASKRSTWQRYVVRRGDTLSGIAARVKTPITVIRRKNALQHSSLRIGQTLLVPAGPTLTIANQEVSSGKMNHISVKRGDSLWTLAKRHKVAIKDLARWNGMHTDQQLKPGQRLTLYQED
ncbi:LysM peptidoglycan-binding domain-containing protein [Phytohalomonas tamaricis]|uniref:LysM peptidoglycan-binding domain-containing protein n=1 Tax=Phytohalomonas tamaricis TaxID=2081032 RepID=UPI000D0BB87C|nr:LysM peptidoglycan-binding domain-containing protein [Phytohalomonas tamaricis]